MKKIFTLAMSLAVVSFAFGQSPRTVLVEEATNASCGPCAAQNPYFNELLDANTDNVVSIKYQAPYPGYDPMNAHNPSDVSNRLAYYPGITGVPTAMIDGEIPTFGDYPGFQNAYAGAPGAYSQAMFDYATEITSPFEIDFDYTLTEDEITVTATATCTQATSGDLKFHVVVVEKEILFETAPGSNGETEFTNIMKKMLPTANGETMAASYEVGGEFTTTQSWNLSNVYRMDRIAVVVYIQNDDNKEVLQAGEVFKAYNNQDVEALTLVDLPLFNCEPTATPSVVLRNNGSTVLTSVNINYELNGESGVIEWTGSLEFYESETVSLGNLTYTPDGNDVLEITLTDPNDGADDIASNNDLSATLPEIAVESTTLITVDLLLDSYPTETSWAIGDSDGNILASGGPYAAGQANQTIEELVQVENLDCYYFAIADSYGDGLNAAAFGGVNGSYNVTSSDGVEIASGGGSNQFSLVVDGFEATSFVSAIEDVLVNESFSLYPNPSSENVNIALELISSQNVTIDVYDIVGKTVLSKDFGTMSAGYSVQNLNVNQLTDGVYMMNVNIGENTIVSKFVVRH